MSHQLFYNFDPTDPSRYHDQTIDGAPVLVGEDDEGEG